MPQDRTSAWGRFREGLQLGMLLQLAVGPACLFVLRAASDQGLAAGLAAALAVFLVDCVFLTLAAAGVARWVGDGRERPVLRLVAAAVVALFAVDIAASALRGSGPALTSFATLGAESGAFVGAFLLTAASPLTIVFWAGVFAAKVSAERYSRSDLALFSIGCVTATIAFLGAVAVAGSLLAVVTPGWLMRLLNLVVALALMVFAARLAWRKTVVSNAPAPASGE